MRGDARTRASLRGDHRLQRTPDAVQVPPIMQVVLASRIYRVAPEDKRILQTASVVGKDVPVAVLAGIAEAEEGALGASLERLEAVELLDEVRLFPSPEFTFTRAAVNAG